jgi:hypothetical protein
LFSGNSKDATVPSGNAVNAALTGAKTNFTPFFSATGLTLNGKEYKSPAPAAYFGAKGTN